jgi:hypothetical protein
MGLFESSEMERVGGREFGTAKGGARAGLVEKESAMGGNAEN